jgi:hypothetical protein
LNEPCAASWKVLPVAVAFTGKADMPLIVPIGRE